MKARIVLDYCNAYSVNMSEDKTVSIQELVTAAESDELSNDQKKQADKDLDLIQNVMKQIQSTSEALVISQDSSNEVSYLKKFK